MTIKMKDVREALVEMTMQATWVLQHCREDALLDEITTGELSLKMKAVTELAVEFRTPPVMPMPAPCPTCGYNGPGYYQPDTHTCVRDDDYYTLKDIGAEREGGR